MGALKVVLLGDSAVGKSSLLHRFTSNTFDPNLPNTIGAAFVSTEHSVAEKKVKLEVWDTAGQERYRSLTPMYYRNGKVALVCFDMSVAEASFSRARYWLEQLKLSGPPDIIIKVVGTKADLVNEENTNNETALAEIEALCSDQGLAFYRTSAKTNSGVDRIFDDIVADVDEADFAESAPPSVSLRESPQTRCC